MKKIINYFEKHNFRFLNIQIIINNLFQITNLNLPSFFYLNFYFLV